MADVASVLLHVFPGPSFKQIEAKFDNLKQTAGVAHHALAFQRLYKHLQRLDPLYRLNPARLAEKFRLSLNPALSEALFFYNFRDYDKVVEMAVHLESKYPIAAINAGGDARAQPLACHYCREVGHFIASCPKMPPCPHCHKVGHRSSLCPERSGNPLHVTDLFLMTSPSIPHLLVSVRLVIGSRRVNTIALLDCGATSNFIDWSFCRHHEIPVRSKRVPFLFASSTGDTCLQ
ncbi:hypothetical protein PBRA_009645 [Plasmodiophora brassicae]|uniref:CCHC-type domain-containing protein n=1 Tax=Plasmodiophora brassicae TaxID=37360 RepID=A0A0G4IJN3_PLABS|nr:hypothetical protein PBRA_009645 [Plasmodiophora brassicae]